MLCSTYMIIPFSSIHHVIMKYAPAVVVAPHGMTDLVHARKYRLVEELCRINMGTIVGAFACHHFHQESIITGLFLVSSAVHFRNDMPGFGTAGIQRTTIQLMLSSTLIASTTIISWDAFMYYMIFIHVPNHYRINYLYIKDSKCLTALMVSGLSGVLVALSYAPIQNPYMDWATKALIIAHVIYEEVHIFRSVPLKR